MNIDSRLEQMRDRLARVKLARENEPEPDALSLSLWEFGAELAALDDEGTVALAAELGISPDDVRQMALDFSR